MDAGKTAKVKASDEDGLNTVFKGQPRNLPQPLKEVVPGHHQEWVVGSHFGEGQTF